MEYELRMEGGPYDGNVIRQRELPYWFEYTRQLGPTERLMDGIRGYKELVEIHTYEISERQNQLAVYRFKSTKRNDA